MDKVLFIYLLGFFVACRDQHYDKVGSALQGLSCKDDKDCPVFSKCVMVKDTCPNCMFRCVNLEDYLCMGCSSHHDCNPPDTITKGFCADIGNEKRCLTMCEYGCLCPEGYKCESKIIDKLQINLCVPEEGKCPCFEKLCNDNIECTVDKCGENNQCIHTIQPDYCLIAQKCYKHNQENPNNECEKCDVSISQILWAQNNGVNCKDDGNPCTSDICSSKVCVHPPKPKGTPCGGGNQCDGNGNCGECASDKDCPPSDQPCTVNQCLNGKCVLVNRSDGVGCGPNEEKWMCKICIDGACICNPSPPDINVCGSECLCGEITGKCCSDQEECQGGQSVQTKDCQACCQGDCVLKSCESKGGVCCPLESKCVGKLMSGACEPGYKCCEIDCI